jgi:hypothetical protein
LIPVIVAGEDVDRVDAGAIEKKLAEAGAIQGAEVGE